MEETRGPLQVGVAGESFMLGVGWDYAVPKWWLALWPGQNAQHFGCGEEVGKPKIGKVRLEVASEVTQSTASQTSIWGGGGLIKMHALI